MWLPVLLHGTYNIIASFASLLVGLKAESCLLAFSFLYVRYRLLPLLNHQPKEPHIRTLVKEGVVKSPTVTIMVVTALLSLTAYYISIFRLLDHVSTIFDTYPLLSWEYF